jgi:coenzyme F420 hydrogenase subunit beta
MARAFVATTVEQVISASGSKYAPVSLAECLGTLENGKRYAIVGLPCHIYSVRKLAEYSSEYRSIHFYFGVLCGGLPKYIGTEYLLKAYGMDKRKITHLEYRGNGWPGKLLIQSDEPAPQKTVSISYPAYWQGVFGYFCHYRCTLCEDGFNKLSDISFGDAWLSDIKKKDREGTSLILTRTENGERLVQSAVQKKCIEITAITDKAVLTAQKGLLHFKEENLKARIELSKLRRRDLPLLDVSRLPNATYNSYLAAMDLYIGELLASRKKFWWFLNLFTLSKRYMGYLLHKFKELIS